MSAFATTSSSILVRWFEVPEPDRNGLILGYKVCLCFLCFTVIHYLFTQLLKDLQLVFRNVLVRQCTKQQGDGI